jgi:N-acyl-D-aspartate/D-glutamate deacylase
MMIDLLIRGGTLVDGTGTRPVTGDIAVQGGRIVELGGRIASAARRTIDADGLLVTPGFVDVHTHFDGQLTWDSQLEPSFSHGVTTIVAGNCGVGFAPVRPGREDDLIKLMEGVEDIPGAVLSEGIKWSWESFPQYMDALEGRRFSMDVGTQIPHGALRAYAMGQRGFDDLQANEEDIAAMAVLVEQAVHAGALGVSTSRSEAHQSSTGQAVPGTWAEQRELTALAQGLQRGGGGVLQAIPTLMDGYENPGLSIERTTTAAEVEMLGRVSQATGCTVTFLMLQNSRRPDEWRQCLAASDAANANGARLVPQVPGRPIGTLVSLGTYHLFQRRPTYMKIAGLPLAERAAEMRKPEVRAAILAEENVPPASGALIDNMHLILAGFLDAGYPLADRLDYDPGPDGSIAAIARRTGQDPMAVIYDEFVKDDGKAFVVFYVLGYQERNFGVLHAMLTHHNSVLGLGDGGAHTRFACDASTQTFMLSHWASQAAGKLRLPIEFVVRKQAADTARLYGFHDRGVLGLGKRADLNLIDLDNLALDKPRVHHDLPAGGARILQASSGYVGTFVAGVQTRDHDGDTGERPGRLIRRQMFQ